MPRQKLSITSINGGFAPTQDFGGDGTYQFGLGVDPDYSLRSTLYRKSGALVPTRYEKFSTTILGSAPLWLITDPKDTKLYTVLSNGSIISYDNSLGSETLINNSLIAFDAASGGNFTATTSKTVSHTTTGSNLVMIVALALDNGGSTNFACTYNGVAMTLVDATTGTDRNVVMFYLIAPATGAHNVVASWTGNNTGEMDVRTYTGVHQTVAIGTPAKMDTGSTQQTSHSVTVTSATGELVVDAICAEGTPTVGSGQTQRYSNSIFTDFSAGSDEFGAASVTMSWATATNKRSALIAVPLKPTTASATNNGNGGVYYNNYLYLMSSTNVGRYGPLDGTPAINNSFWVTTLSKTALNDKTYPSIAGIAVPNHAGHVHGDNALYFCDTLNGQGIIHKIKTRKTTAEGDTDDGSTYNALDLPFGFFGTDIESWGTDLVICTIQTTDSNANQGRAALFLWDTVSDTFYAGPIWISDPLATALLNVNGQIIIWSGTAQQGCRVSKYLGGVQISEMLLLEEACPPFAGAVLSDGNRIYWGGFTTYPTASACVYSYGSKDARLTQGLHIPIKTSSAGSTPNVTSLTLYSQTGFARTKLVVGWKDASDQGLDKVSTSATYAAKFRSQPFNIGQKFRVAKVRIPLGATLATNMEVTPKIYFDDENDSMTLTVINNTNFTSAQRKILYKDTQLDTKKGENNFFLELAWGGTVECPIKFPIDIEIETFENEQTI